MKVATQRRLEDYAEAVGSKAKTISGMMRAVRAHGLPQKILPWLDRQARRKPARRDDDDKAYGHCVAAAIAARRAGAKPHQRNDAMIGAMILAGVPESQYDLYYSYFRMRLGLNGNHELYPISGIKSSSTLRGLIGVEVIKKIASMGGLKRHRGAVRGDLVLAVRRADNYALRAVAVALERAGL